MVICNPTGCLIGRSKGTLVQHQHPTESKTDFPNHFLVSLAENCSCEGFRLADDESCFGKV